MFLAAASLGRRAWPVTSYALFARLSFAQKKRHAVACRTFAQEELASTYWPYLALASATHLSLAAPVSGSHFSRATL
jgi:hypothetical protein